MTYQRFANIYDRLMDDVPYELWLNYFLKRVNSKSQKVLDLGCGTGSISIPIAKKGYQVTGLDLSEEMLSIADEKARKEQVNIRFLQKNMVELSDLVPERFDTIISFCDSINYLMDEDEVLQTLKGVYDLLEPDGTFMFDVHSTEKMEEIFANQTFVSNDEDVSFIWNCFQGEESYSVDHELTFFVKRESGLYERFDETHSQRTFPIQFYKQLLEQIGFHHVEISSDFQDQLGVEELERIFFTCQKK